MVQKLRKMQEEINNLPLHQALWPGLYYDDRLSCRFPSKVICESDGGVLSIGSVRQKEQPTLRGRGWGDSGDVGHLVLKPEISQAHRMHWSPAMSLPISTAHRTFPKLSNLLHCSTAHQNFPTQVGQKLNCNKSKGFVDVSSVPFFGICSFFSVPLFVEGPNVVFLP